MCCTRPWPSGTGSAWLILQGIETLPLRMARHISNTERVVQFLASQSFVAHVGHPLLDSHPASTTYFRMSDEALAGAGISQGTIRLSIGLEDPDDLIEDLKRALKAAKKV